MEIIPTDNTVDLLKTFLDVQTRRAEVTSSNIANADTPGYVAKELDFQDFLRQAARDAELSPQQTKNSLDNNSLRVVEKESGAVGLDGNTVDAGREMADLAQTGSNFNFGVKMLQSRLRLLRTAIREGK